MAAGTTPIFVATPKMWQVSTGTTGNANLDGTGVIATVLTAGTNGSKVEDLFLCHLGTNVATAVRLFVDVTGAGTAYKLVHEETMAANTLSQVAASIQMYVRLPLILPAGAKVGVSIGTSIASGIMVTAQGGDY